jgi:hypothetical protein
MDAARTLGFCPLALALLVLGAGCQRPVTLHQVSGKVTYKGIALNNGIVVFTPDSGRGESGPVALGTIREDGTYSLTTGDSPGASPGWYRVTVGSFAAGAPKSPPPNGFQPPVPLLPDRYRDPETSLLRCQIKPNEINNIDLKLD